MYAYVESIYVDGMPHRLWMKTSFRHYVLNTVCAELLQVLSISCTVLTSNQTAVRWAAMGSSRCRMEGSGSVTKLHRARADSLRAAGVPMSSNLSSHLSRNPSSSCSPVVEARPGPRRGSWGPVASQNCRNQSGVCSRARAYTVTASAETHHCGVACRVCQCTGSISQQWREHAICAPPW